MGKRSLVKAQLDSISTEHLEHAHKLLDEVHEHVSRRKSSQTTEGYRRDFEHFQAWCDKLGFQALPASEKAITGFISTMAFTKPGYKPATILRRLAGIAHAHDERGLPSPITRRTRKYLLKVRENEAVDTKIKKAPPLLVPELKTIVATMNDAPGALREVAIRDKAALVLGWNCAMRRSEIVALDYEDLFRKLGDRWLMIRGSKTDKAREGFEMPLSFGERHPDLCPLAALDAWLEVRGKEPGPLFWKISERLDGDRLVGGRLLTDVRMPWVQVNRMVTWWCRSSGVQQDGQPRYSPHSLRAGFITAAILAGQIPKVVMERSRHKSVEVFDGYVRIVQNHMNNPAKAVV